MKHTRKLALIALPLLLASASCGWLEEDTATAAKAALAENDYGGARLHLAKLLVEFPADTDIRQQYADALLNLGDGIGAQTALEQLPAELLNSGKPAAMMGHALLLQDKPQDALAWAERAGANSSYALWVQIGGLLASNASEKAFTAADAAIVAHPKDAPLLALRGEMALSQRKIEQAKGFAARALAADKTDFAANTLAGKIALLKEQLEDAESYFTAAVTANPSTPAPYHSLGAVQADLGKYEDAQATLDKANAIAPSHPMGMFLSAKLAFVTGDLDTAHRLMQDAEGSLRQVPAAQLLQGEIAHLRGNHEQSIAFLRPFVRDNPGHIHGATVMAQAMVAVGDNTKAWQVIEEPASRAAASPQLLALASRLAQQTGQKDIFAARLGAKAPPEDLTVRLAQADRALKQQEWAKARKIYAGLRKEGMDANALVLNNGAIASLRSGNAAEALMLARRAISLTPDDPQVMDTMGWVLLQTGGNKAEALRWLAKAQNAMPGNLEIRWHYAAALAANGRKADARKMIAGVREFAGAEQREHIDTLLAEL